jgi:hypothetical protein
VAPIDAAVFKMADCDGRAMVSRKEGLDLTLGLGSKSGELRIGSDAPSGTTAVGEGESGSTIGSATRGIGFA